MKKILISSVLIIGLATGLAFAHGNNWGGHMMSGGNYGMMGGMGSGMMGPQMMDGNGYGDCPGAAWYGRDEESQKNYQEYLDKTTDLRKQMNDLRFDYMEAYRTPNADKATLLKIEQQMNDLRLKMLDIEKQIEPAK
ncbi:hypothetical protein [Desulfopila aestuarii]|uniref:Zinc resistance-associated protein n=1 Tax=Desulfopila aestuarii DSM 18488 TaxID=1121416 RepID=A0A1M7Y3L1_9BACT|nr:hypothetical protein [Desulfopila aestuarii]SHO46728.1 hypothetical protein SAMN02745220_01612 [Desulfopila aestuarii DSM 18488]